MLATRKGGLHLLEGAQHALEIFSRDADPRVAHGEYDAALFRHIRLDGNRAARRCELDRIGKQVHEDLLDGPLVDIDLGIGRGRSTVWTCDLTHGYIDINGSYRS